MNAVQKFEFENREINAQLIENQLWFVAADVCAALDIQNPSQVVSKLDADEIGICSTYTSAGPRTALAVNESGLYALILRSRDAMKPGTPQHRFRKWVTAEVLPTIRRTGAYAPPRFAVALMNSPRLKNGNLDPTNLSTVMTVIATHPDLRGHLRWNATDRIVEVGGEPMEDWHITIFRTVLHREGLKAAKRMVGDAMIAVARSGLTWRA